MIAASQPSTTGPTQRTRRATLLRLVRIGVSLCLGFACLAAPAASTNAPVPARSQHWAFQPRQSTTPPEVADPSWSKTPIDRFILRQLESHGLRPARPADRRTLIRRVTYDLTGLPPTPDAVEQFVADPAPDAYPRLVERLLASPAHGEHWGRHWLDVVRYADARDLIQLPVESDFREAWRYRDWVVRAHNADLPFAEFIRQQIAGDLLQPAGPDSINEDGLVATGLLAIADFVPGDVDKDRMVADYVNDQIDVVGRAFLGLTLACARCHDHKSDPVTMQDYYGLAGIFFSTRLIPSPVKGNTPLVRVPLLCRADLDRIAADRKRAAELETEQQALLNERDAACAEALEQLAVGQSSRYLRALAEVPAANRPIQPATLPALARERALHPLLLEQWRQRVETESQSPSPGPVPGWDTLVKAAATGGVAASVLNDAARELDAALATAHDRQQAAAAGSDLDPLRKTLALRISADDPRLVTNREARITHWPGRGRGPRQFAVPVASASGPLRTNTAPTTDAGARAVARFSGKDLLEFPMSAPAAGSLVAVFRRADPGADGQRLIGWEDSDSGKHGVGLMLKPNGGLHAILRNDGASGDLVEGPTTNQVRFEIVTLTWGTNGTVLRHDGRQVGANAAIARISSDPAIPRLRIGGPGSGGSSRFNGDLAELRLYATALDDAACRRIETELNAVWNSTTPPPAHASDPAGALLDSLASQQGPFWLPESERDALVSPALQARLKAGRDQLAATRARIPAEIPQAVVVQDGGPAETRHAGFKDAVIYLRGDPKRPGPSVPRGFPAVLAAGRQPDPAVLTNTSGRRQLADWLASPDNPLAARVAVNRLWQHHFGEGIVRTSTNFGERGERPSHPELLDYLAGQFVASGGSLKSLHRLIVLSATYQQDATASTDAAAKDPENRWLSHMNRRRLAAEEIRDTLLAVSGGLSNTPGGPALQDVAAPRRSLYLMAVRTGAKTGFAPLFDAPDCGAIVDRRTVSTVAPQALFLLNDAFTIEQARALASRVEREPSRSPEADVRAAYRHLLARTPTADELRIGTRLVGDCADTEALRRFCQVLLCTNELLYLD